MLIGDKKKLALECQITSTADSFIYCSFALWVDSLKLVVVEEESVLGVLINSSKVFLRYTGNRQYSGSTNLSGDELHKIIVSACHSDLPERLRESIEGRYRQRYLLHEIADDSIGVEYFITVVDEASKQ